MSLRIATLGGLRVFQDGHEIGLPVQRRNRAALFVYLALERNVSRDTVASIFWPESDTEKARHSLSQAIYQLRQMLGDDWIVIDGDRIRCLSRVQTDVEEFERDVAEENFETALRLYSAAFLSGVDNLPNAKPFEMWVDGRRAHYERIHRRARRAVIDAHCRVGNLPAAIAAARAWTQLDPTEDEAQHKLIELLAAGEDPVEAVRQYETYERLLAADDLVPLDQTKALIARVRSQARYNSGARESNQRITVSHRTFNTDRRSPWRALAVYVVGSSAAWQLINDLTNRLGLPDWVPAFALVLFLLFLPVVAATAFMQERRRVRARVKQKSSVLFTWRNAILAGAGAFLLLGISAAGYMASRYTGVGPFASLLASGTLKKREPVIVADFGSVAADTALAAAVTQAFRATLAHSGVVTVVEPEDLRTVLARMSRAPASRLTSELASEVALRENIRAVITGYVARAGVSYAISAQLRSPANTNALVVVSRTARDSTEVLVAVEKLARKLRERVGESLRTINTGRAIEAVTTPSLAALLKYTQGAYAHDRETDYERAAMLLREAIALDSTFAMAWRKLAIVYINSGAARDKTVPAIAKAYQYRDRLTDVERLQATGLYVYFVKRNYNDAIATYRNLLELEPRNRDAWNMLGHAYAAVGHHEAAAGAFEKARQADPTGFDPWGNRLGLLVKLGHSDSARTLVRALERQFGHGPEVVLQNYWIASAARDFRALDTLLNLLAREPSPTWRRRVLELQAEHAALRGRLREAESYLDEAMEVDAQRGNVAAYFANVIAKASTDRIIRRNPARAAARLDAAVSQRALDSIPPLSRPYLPLATAYAAAGRPENARALVREFERVVPVELRPDVTREMWLIGGLGALATGSYDAALRDLQRANMPGAIIGRGYESQIAQAFDAAGHKDSAIAHYERRLNTPHPRQINIDARELAANYERLAELYDERGDGQKAAIYAARFIELWRDADPELQPRVHAKQLMLERWRRRR